MNTPITSVPLTDDTTLINHFAPMLDTAIRRQLWIFFLDEDDRPLGPAMPIDDYPTNPRARVKTDDVGEHTAAELFGIRFASLTSDLGLAQIVLVWERPGGRALKGVTREWARMLGDALQRHGAQVRAHLLLHSGGLRVIAPGELR